MKFGKHLKILRIEVDMTLKDLSKETGIDISYLSKVERSVVNPPTKNEILEKIASALKLDQEKKEHFFNLASTENCSYPNDIQNELKSKTAIPILLRAINNKKLTDEAIIKIVNDIIDIYEGG